MKLKKRTQSNDALVSAPTSQVQAAFQITMTTNDALQTKRAMRTASVATDEFLELTTHRNDTTYYNDYFLEDNFNLYT